MPKTKISEFSATPANNTDIDSINIAEGCAPSGINDAIRELMSQLKDFQTGAVGDSFNGPINGTLGATTPATASVTTLTTSSTVTHNGGTANGVTYLNGSKVLTSGSALVFDGANLGLGVTPSAQFSTVRALQIGQGAILEGRTNGPNMSIGANFYLDSSAVYRYPYTDFASRYTQATGQHFWYTAPSGTAGNAISFTQAMTLDASGNLMLGTTTQLARANFAESVISGEADVLIGNSAGSGTNNTAALYLSGQNTLVRSAAIKAIMGGSSEHSLAFFTNGAFADPAERARITSGGFLGVATTSPQAPIHAVAATTVGTDSSYAIIAGDSASTNRRLLLGYTGSGNGYGVIQGVVTGTAWTDVAICPNGGNLLVGTTSVLQGIYGASIKYSNNVMGIQRSGGTEGTCIGFLNQSGTTTGSIYNFTSSTNYNTTSDYRLKESIAPMTGALAKVAALKPVTYKWKSDGSDGQGFIAHELAEVVPECVTGQKDAVDADGNPKYQGIDTSFLVATLTSALQELNAKFEAYVASHP